MVLESTMICLDNSEYQRNGDYFPTRLNVQKDGANLVCHTKLRSNPENNVGLLTMSYTSQVLATLTSEAGRIFSKMEAVQPKGEISLVPSIRIAHLALKHRQGKNHKMRIVAFVGSPINVDEAELVKLAKRLKKEKVNVDIVSFGEHANNNELLTVFVDTLNGKDGTGSHLVSVPRGSVLSDALLSSPIIQGEDGTGGAGLGGGSYEFGIDPNEDPELVLALRVSMEEQRQRQEEEQRRAQGEGGASAATAAASDAPAAPGGGEKPAAVAAAGSGGAALAAAAAVDEDNSEEAMLQRAIAMSTETEEDNMPDFSTMTEEEQIAFAMQMSMQDADVTQQAKRPKTEESTQMDVDEDYSEVIGDPAFLQSVLENLPGVDPQSEAVRDALGSLNKDKKNPDAEKK